MNKKTKKILRPELLKLTKIKKILRQKLLKLMINLKDQRNLVRKIQDLLRLLPFLFNLKLLQSKLNLPKPRILN